MNLTDYAYKAYTTANNHGFHDKCHQNMQNNDGQLGVTHKLAKLALVMSEVGEAVDAVRKNKYTDMKDLQQLATIAKKNDMSEQDEEFFREHIKDTFEDELADTIIRIFDLCGLLSIDIDSHVKAKMLYNDTRPAMHGKLA